MKTICALLVVFGAVSLARPVPAQPARAPTENVTVSGTRSHDVIRGFVQSFAAPTRMTGKIARWEEGICPVTVGLPVGFAKFVTRRVKDVAAKVGAPVNDKESCEHNIAIVFTTKPQALLDKVRENQDWLLGYHDSSAQAEQMAKVTHAIQAWYTTATIDANGWPQFDAGGMRGGIKFYATTGSRLDDGLHSGFYDVIIVVDPDRLVDYEIGSLADYIALLALTQSNSLDTCQQLPSIVNMLAVGCERRADALTDNDIAYLRGLYKMSPGRALLTQRDEIAYQMEQGGGK